MLKMTTVVIILISLLAVIGLGLSIYNLVCVIKGNRKKSEKQKDNKKEEQK